MQYALPPTVEHADYAASQLTIVIYLRFCLTEIDEDRPEITGTMKSH